jgi:hypothetical protein
MSDDEAQKDMLFKAQQFAMKELMDSCPAKTAIGGVMGFGMGGLFERRI